MATLPGRPLAFPKGAKFQLSVPGSTANLGPGFDSLGLALELGLKIELRLGADRDTIRWSGEGAGELPLDQHNLVWHGVAAARARWGGGVGLAIRVRSAIPVGRGLGSSAAAVVAGLAAGALSCGRRPRPQELLELGAQLEGHADNVAASILGGLVLVALEEDQVTALRLPLARGLKLLLAIPNRRLETAAARALLPAEVPLADAVANLQHFGLLLVALTHGPAELLGPALRDRLHQPYRKRLVPELEELLALRPVGLRGACLSGSGPTVIAFVTKSARGVEGSLRRILGRHGGGQVRRCRCALVGLTWKRVP